jgi:hypothetical protein
MVKKKKYPTIVPQFLLGKNGKPVKVYLPYDVYESIFEEIEDLKKEIELEKKKLKNK